MKNKCCIKLDILIKILLLIITIGFIISIFLTKDKSDKNCDTCKTSWGTIELTAVKTNTKLFDETWTTDQFLPKNYPISNNKSENIYGFTQLELSNYLTNPNMTYNIKQDQATIVMYPFLNISEDKTELELQRISANSNLKEYPSDNAKTIIELDSSKGRIATLAKLYTTDKSIITVTGKDNTDESYVYIMTSDHQYGFIKNKHIQP